MRRVLMITPHFPPDSSAAAHRVRLLAPHLVEYGWEPTVLTLRPSAYEGALDPPLAALVPPSLAVVRASAWSAHWTRRLGIGDLGLRSFTGLRRAAIAMMAAEKFDALFITIYPTYQALLGPLLKRRFHVPFVLDYQDPWVGSWGATVGGGPGGSPDLKSRLTRRVAEHCEPLAVRAADAITAVSTATYEDVLARVFTRHRPVVATLPLGWEAADFSSLGGQTKWFDAGDGNIHLSYVGTLLPNGFGVLRALLGAVRTVRDTDPGRYARLRLHFFGTANQSGGDQPNRVMPVAAECGVDDVVSEHAGRIPYLDALGVLSQSTGILLLGSSEPHYTASKIYPALLANRPILALFHAASSVTTILRQATRPPTVRLLAYSHDPAPEDVFPLLRDLIAAPRVEPGGINLQSASHVSARAIAGDLCGVLDQVHARN